MSERGAGEGPPPLHLRLMGAATDPTQSCKTVKCPTEVNPADLMTKGLGRERIQSLMQLLYYQLRGGRSSLAPIRPNTGAITSPAPIDPDFDSEQQKSTLHS